MSHASLETKQSAELRPNSVCEFVAEVLCKVFAAGTMLFGLGLHPVVVVAKLVEEDVGEQECRLWSLSNV
jgi:hypothetical protein